jgi:flagellar basal-body rod protein FlgC
MIGAIQTALSGLNAATTRVNAAADNIANSDDEGSLDGAGPAPYAAVTVQQTTTADGGTSAAIVQKSPAFVPAYDPSSPFANNSGQVGAPNVDLTNEAVNLTTASIAYKANAAVIKTVDAMQDDLLKAFDQTA